MIAILLSHPPALMMEASGKMFHVKHCIAMFHVKHRLS
jgi:hypothetical protein